MVFSLDPVFYLLPAFPLLHSLFISPPLFRRPRADFPDVPLPTCTHPYLLAVYSDGPPDKDLKPSNGITPASSKSSDGLDYNSFQALEWIGDSLLSRYLRTHWWQFYGTLVPPICVHISPINLCLFVYSPIRVCLPTPAFAANPRRQ